MIVATLWLGISPHVFAAVNGWTAMGPSGGTVNKVAFNQATPSIVYAIATEGFYRSTDGGSTWTLVYSNFENAPSDLETDPSDPTRVYIITQNYPFLYASSDSGATMAPVTTLPTSLVGVDQVALAHNGTTLYVNSGAQIFCSTDRASTWTAKTAVSTYANAQIWRLAVDPSDANTLYATATVSATSEATLVSHDGAMTWQTVVSGDPSTANAGAVLGFAFNPSNVNQIWAARYDGVWVSNDKGVSWSNSLTTAASAIALDPSNPSVVYALVGYSVMRTADGGATWADVTGNEIVGQLSSIAIDPAQSVHVLLSGMNGVAGSTASGTQWSNQSTGINSTTIQGLSADAAADRIYANIESGGIYYAAAGAASLVGVNNFGSGGLLALSQQPTLDVTAMLAQAGQLSASLSNGLARSTDGGNTWSMVQVAPSGVTNQLFSLASWPANPQTVLAASSSTLYRTTDGGALWEAATNGLPSNASVASLAAAASDSSTAYASIGNTTQIGVYKTSDAGLTWSVANTSIGTDIIDSLTVDPTTPGVVYAATEAGLLKSADGGATWNPLTWDAGANQGYPDVIAVDPKHPNILYAAREFIARSVDGGSTWQILRATGIFPVWFPSLLIDPNRPENLLVGTLHSGVQQFTVEPDLSLSLAAPSGPVGVGVATAYPYSVSNLGPFDATGVTVSIQLPTSAQSVSATASAGSCSVAASVATCTFPVLATGSSDTITLNATSPAVGTLQLEATVAGDQPDPNSANNTVSTSQSIANVADLSVTSAGTASAALSAGVSYTLVVSNAGPNVASMTQLTFQLAAGLSFVSASGGGATCTANSAGLVTCSLGDLAAGKSASVTVNATATAAGTLVSVAAVSSLSTDTSNSNNSASSSTAVTGVDSPPGKGGGGSVTVEWLLLLAALVALRHRAGAGRERAAGF